MVKRSASLTVNLLILFLVIACASSPPPKKDIIKKEIISSPSLTEEIKSSHRMQAMNEKLMLTALSSKRDLYRDYKIGPEDLLEISIFEEEKLNKTVRVSSQGNISLPLLGVIRVKGLTANELEKEIQDLLAEKYLQDPHVSVFIKEYRSQRISVMGAVDKPGVFDITGQKTILDMLGMAGGLKVTDIDGPGQLLFLIRPPQWDDSGTQEKKESEDQTPKTFIIDLEEFLVKGNLSLNLPVSHGDVINIPISGKVFVGGEVRSPGGFPLKGKKIMVSQAIAMAGGLTDKSNGSEAKIFRYSGKSPEREILPVNIYSIQKGKEEDPYVKENDIIVVPKSGLKTFLIELRTTVTGLLGVGYSLGSL